VNWDETYQVCKTCEVLSKVSKEAKKISHSLNSREEKNGRMKKWNNSTIRQFDPR